VTLSFLADAVLVLAFVLIGRASHDEDPVLGALVTYWPFAVGLVVGWLAARAWRDPLAFSGEGFPRTAFQIVFMTVAVGLLLRVISGQGIQLSFVIVTTVVLVVFLVGWRAVAWLVRGRLAARAAKG
jgi:hypothetical protein